MLTVGPDLAVVLALAAPAPDDRGVFEGLRRRNPQALADLYDLYGRAVYSLINRIVRDSGVAEDLVQETFLRVWNRAHVIDPARGSPGAWLLTIARNRAIDWVRSASGKPETTWESYDAERPANFQEMETLVIHSDQARRVRKAMEKLNDNHRSVIELAYFEGLSQSEMATRMGQPLGTVKTWVRSALKTLREELSAS